jgi:hypothetical protein
MGVTVKGREIFGHWRELLYGHTLPPSLSGYVRATARVHGKLQSRSLYALPCFRRLRNLCAS